jgi:hypothetical protein
MRSEGNVFKCWSSRWDAVYYGELGSSKAVLEAGYNLECFMSRWAPGIDRATTWSASCRGGPLG